MLIYGRESLKIDEVKSTLFICYKMEHNSGVMMTLLLAWLLEGNERRLDQVVVEASLDLSQDIVEADIDITEGKALESRISKSRKQKGARFK